MVHASVDVFCSPLYYLALTRCFAVHSFVSKLRFGGQDGQWQSLVEVFAGKAWRHDGAAAQILNTLEGTRLGKVTLIGREQRFDDVD